MKPRLTLPYDTNSKGCATRVQFLATQVLARVVIEYLRTR